MGEPPVTHMQYSYNIRIVFSWTVFH